ncbi:3096_t:CDS:1 [Paraglomus brasilianum]|uniref:3096_t:CDS:1 n=1 Tax=Paraglomus brasilianum TaxID=144538 RepID=A0A9N9FYY5_9GLOM|nr:3096_t:CDS:1 [Paraglomus brasilianum]
MSSNSINQPILRQVHSHTELCAATNSTCPATCFINNLTPTELELIRNPPYPLTISYDSILNPIRKRRKNSNKRNLPPRPQNAWVLFRRNFQSQERSQRPDGSHTLKEISKTAAENWKSQPKEVKQYFNLLSKLASRQHKVMYPEYVYNPRKFKNGENFIFKHMDKDKIAKSCKNKASLSKKAKQPIDLSNTDCSNDSENLRNDEQQSNLPSPSPIVDSSSFSLYEISDLPYFLTLFPQCQFPNDINSDNINANEQIGFTDVGFGHYSYYEW